MQEPQEEYGLKNDKAIKRDRSTVVSGRRCFDWEDYLERKRIRRRMSGLLLLAGMIGMLFVSSVLLRGKHYIIVGFGGVLLLLVLFFGQYERRKPQAREVVLLSTLTALCVVMNEICAHTIPLHAGTTMVVICGIGLGPEAGFMVGAMSRLVCNFFDGQGPWTPWQMAAWGMVGYLSGMAFNKVERRKIGEKESLARRLSLEKGRSFRVIMGPVLCILFAWVLAYIVFLLRGGSGESFFGWRLYLYGIAGIAAGCLLQRKKLPVDDITTTIFTFFVVFLLYGGVMNFAAMLMSYSADPSGAGISWKTLKALYLTGAPYDASHAGTAALCMFLFGDSILQKLERIQGKFGITL